MTLQGDQERRFRNWLTENTSLKDRSIGDVLSRTRRVMRIVNPLAPETVNELEYRLRQKSQYTQCSVSVRSQLKRAAKLYRRFYFNRGNGGEE